MEKERGKIKKTREEEQKKEEKRENEKERLLESEDK
jgi:hypothetical protein